MNDLDVYQRRARETAVYPPAQGLAYAALDLASEAGEVAGEVKRVIRDDGGELTAARRAKLRDELGDALWGLSATAYEAGLTLSEVAAANLEKLGARKAAGRIKGAGVR